MKKLHPFGGKFLLECDYSENKIQDLLNISQVYNVNNMRCNYYNSYYMYALIKQGNKTNGSTQSCIFDPSSKHQTLDVPFIRRHMHTSDTDTQNDVDVLSGTNNF